MTKVISGPAGVMVFARDGETVTVAVVASSAPNATTQDYIEDLPADFYEQTVGGSTVTLYTGGLAQLANGDAPTGATWTFTYTSFAGGDDELGELADKLRAYVTPEARHVAIDDDFVRDCAAQALALVVMLIGDAETVPAEIRERAIIEAGSELFHKRQAPNGISQFADAAGTPLRVARDPMNVARVILQPFLPLAFA